MVRLSSKSSPHTECCSRMWACVLVGLRMHVLHWDLVWGVRPGVRDFEITWFHQWFPDFKVDFWIMDRISTCSSCCKLGLSTKLSTIAGDKTRGLLVPEGIQSLRTSKGFWCDFWFQHCFNFKTKRMRFLLCRTPWCSDLHEMVRWTNRHPDVWSL